MIMRFVIPAAAMVLLSGFTQAELEKAKNTKEFYKDGYWKCLATEIVRVVPTNMSAQEFSVFGSRLYESNHTRAAARQIEAR